MYFGHDNSGGYFDTSCFPSSTLSLGVSAWALYYYSPAHCPLGWYQATQFTGSYGGFGSTALSVGPSTTAVLCCPSGYFYQITDGFSHRCQSAFTSTSSTLTYINPTLQNVWFSTDGKFASTIIAVASPTYNVYGDGIPVWWQSSDLAAFSAATSQPTTPTDSPTSSAPTTTSSTNSFIPPASPSGLSSGTKIVIGIGIPLVIIALGISAFIWFARSRHRDRVVQPELESIAMDKCPQELQTDKTIIQELYSDCDPYRYSQIAEHAELAGH